MGFVYHFFHALWYRLLVDLLIYKVKLTNNKDGSDIRVSIKKVLNIDA